MSKLKNDYLNLSIVILCFFYYSLMYILGLNNIKNAFIIISVTILIIIIQLKKLIINATHKNDWAILILIVGCLIWFLYPAIIQFAFYFLKKDNYIWIFEEEIIIKGTFLVIIYITSLIVFYNLFKNISLFEKRRKIESEPREKIIINLSLIGLLTGMLPYIYFSKGIKDAVKKILYLRDYEKEWLTLRRFGDIKSFLCYVALSCLIGSALMLWLYALKKRNKIISAGMSVIAMLILIDQGTRSLFILLVGPIIAIMIFDIYIRKQKKYIIISAISVILLIILLSAVSSIRYKGNYVNVKEDILKNVYILNGDIDYFIETLNSVYFISYHLDYLKENIFKDFILSVIPRFLWSEKPASYTVWYYTYFRAGIDIDIYGGNILPGIIGQFYMNWGNIGVIIAGGLIGALSGIIDKRMKKLNYKKNIFIFGIYLSLCFWIFISFRQLSPGFIYPILIAIVIYKLSKIN